LPAGDAPDRCARQGLRIVHLITRLIVGGAQRLALETAVALQDRGHRVALWTGPQTGPEGSLQEEAAARGLQVVVIPDLVREVAPWRDARAFGQLLRRLRHAECDILHTHSSKAGILGRWAAAAAGVPARVHSIHGWAMTPASSRPVNALYTLLEKLSAPRAQRLIAVSAVVRAAGLARGIGRPEQYAVIHGGICPPRVPTAADRVAARTRLGVPREAIVLGTLGRLDDAKNPVGALETALPLLEEDARRWLVFIGDGHLRPELERRIAAAPQGSRVRLAGLQHGAADLLAGLDVFFLSSLWEGFPLVCLEAMAAQLPIVAYDVGGIREAVRSRTTGYVVPAGHTAAWRDALGRLLREEGTRHQFGLAGRQRLETQYHLDTMIARTIELYDRVSPH
jgi:glycosyltransferase involved in cell wall biosynthesis